MSGENQFKCFRRFLGTYVFCLVIVSPIRLAKADELNLLTALNEALERSPVIQKSESISEGAEWRARGAYSGFLPVITASSTHLIHKKYLLTDINLGGSPASVPAIVPTSNFLLSAQLPLFDGFASSLNLKAAWASEDSAHLELEWTRFKLRREVSLSFFRALAAQTLKEVAEQNVKTLSDHLRDVRLFKNSGVSTNYDVLRVEVQVSEAQSEAMNADDNVVLLKNRLAELLGVDVETRELRGELPFLDAEKLLKQKIEVSGERADLKMLEQKLNAASLQASSASRYWMPRLSAFAQYQYYNNINDDLWDKAHYRNAYQVGFALNWILFDGLSSVAKSKELAQQRVQNEKDLRVAQLKAHHDLEFWQRRFKYFSSITKARKNDVEKSMESVRLAREGHRAGTRTNTDLLDAENELYRSRAGVVNAQLGAVEALLNLELATGSELYKFN